MSIIFDTSTGRRVYRHASARIAARLARAIVRRSVFMWLCEICGVCLIALGAALAYPPAGVAVLGIYAVLIGNSSE